MSRPGAPAGRTICFGPFEFDPQIRELRKHGMRVKAQGQPLDVLAMLLERPGEVVTREELQNRLWPADTYVDFEHSLNAAIKRLRAALGDSAQSARFVETLARQGYRFIAPVSRPEEIPGIAAHNPESAARRRWIWMASGIALIVALAGVFLVLSSRSARNRAAPGSIRSVAVLPLANLSGDSEQDFFVDGMTDALRERLAGISSLRMISRTSSLPYRGSAKPLRDIARELNADAAVGGAVWRSGDRVRISVELVQAGAERRLWGNSYDGAMRDVLALETKVARSVAEEIPVTLTAPDRARLARTRATNPDAYLAYSKGRFYWNKRTAQDLEKAIGFFQQAVEKDPDYALAYDGLADSWVPLGWYGYLSPSATFPNAKAAITKALSLDDSLAEAHTSLAFVKLYYDRDWTGAEQEFRRGIDLNPNYANGRHWYAEFLSLEGRHQEAIAQSQRAREIEPLSPIINAWVSSRYFYARKYENAIAEGRHAVEMDPNFAPARLVLGQAYEQKGMLKEAVQEFQEASRLAAGSLYLGSLAHALGTAGKRADALKAVEDLKKMAQTGFVSSYDLALAFWGVKDRAKTFDLLNAAIKEGSPRAAFLGVDPRFDGLRSDPRTKELLRTLGLDAVKTGEVATTQ